MEVDATPARPLGAYIVWWIVAGVGAATLASLILPRPDQWPSPLSALLLIALVAAADSASLELRNDRSSLSLSLGEAAFVVVLLLFPAQLAILVVPAGLAVRYLLRRTPLHKVGFNVGQSLVAISAASTIMALAPSDPTLSVVRVLLVIVAILSYSLTNTLALAGIFSRLGVSSITDQLTDRPTFLVATTLGNASIGVIAVALWLAYPTIVWVVFGPALALYLAYASGFRIEGLLDDVREERDRLTRVVSGVQEGIVLLDEEGIVRLWNDAMARITGIETSVAINQPAGEVLRVSDPAQPDPLAALRTGDDQPSLDVANLRHTDGTLVPVRFVHGLLRDERGKTIGDVIVAVDLSREREANALKEDFVARVSHELRTPLSPLRGSSQLLLTSGDRLDADQRDQLLRGMAECVDHLDRVVDDLLLVSRIASNPSETTGNVRPEQVELEQLATRLVDWAHSAHPDREIRIVPDDGPMRAWADPVRVGQIVTNLLTNACRYATPGTPIDVVIRRDDDEVVVQVADHGPGIPNDKLEAIFGQFQRLEDPSTMQTRGLGLGLYIARHLAHAMDGSLTADSEQGRGSTFELRLPHCMVSEAGVSDSADRDRTFQERPQQPANPSRLHLTTTR